MSKDASAFAFKLRRDTQRVFTEAYYLVRRVGNLRRTQLMGKRAIYGWKLRS
jgi:hypothetical protein